MVRKCGGGGGESRRGVLGKSGRGVAVVRQGAAGQVPFGRRSAKSAAPSDLGLHTGGGRLRWSGADAGPREDTQNRSALCDLA
eukprot:354449-Chlamydomonas_euryale.AAC.4